MEPHIYLEITGTDELADIIGKLRLSPLMIESLESCFHAEINGLPPPGAFDLKSIKGLVARGLVITGKEHTPGGKSYVGVRLTATGKTIAQRIGKPR